MTLLSQKKCQNLTKPKITKETKKCTFLCNARSPLSSNILLGDHHGSCAV